MDNTSNTNDPPSDKDLRAYSISSDLVLVLGVDNSASLCKIIGGAKVRRLVHFNSLRSASLFVNQMKKAIDHFNEESSSQLEESSESEIVDLPSDQIVSEIEQIMDRLGSSGNDSD